MPFICFFKILEWLGFWCAASFFWVKIYPVRRLKSAEIEAAQMVFAPGQLFLEKIRVHEGSPLCRLSGGRAMAAFRVIHCPKGGETLATMVHELVHVAQFEAIGARYAPEALLAQWHFGSEAYNFEKEGRLVAQIAQGRCFADLNREAQAQLVEAYFIEKMGRRRSARLTEFAPFLAEMRAGKW